MSESAAAAAAAAAAAEALHPAVPLRQSALWSMQRSFYDSHGEKAWSEAVVPCLVTSNAFIAARYARIIAEYVRDAHSA